MENYVKRFIFGTGILVGYWMAKRKYKNKVFVEVLKKTID